MDNLIGVYFSSLASLRKLDEQPEWLRGGKLRDYQLEGLNFLVNRYMLVSVALGCFRLSILFYWNGCLNPEHSDCPINAFFSYSHNSWRNDTNVILADEMGLGKTVQSVSMLGFLQVHHCSFSLLLFWSLRGFHW